MCSWLLTSTHTQDVERQSPSYSVNLTTFPLQYASFPVLIPLTVLLGKYSDEYELNSALRAPETNTHSYVLSCIRYSVADVS